MSHMPLTQRIELELGKREPSELELSNNHIAGGLEALLSCPNIEQLNLSNNKIESFESLAPLVKLSCLRSLDLVNCPVATVENYRKKAFAMFGELKYLDGLDENEEEEPAGEEIPNGDIPEAGENDDEVDEVDDDEEGSDVDDEDDGEDEVGLEALQRSGELEDDEEDYTPGEEEEADLNDYDDDDEEDEDDVEEDTGVNLSAADVTGPRRPAAKRRHAEEAENGEEEEVPCATKHKAGDSIDAHVNNGSTVDK